MEITAMKETKVSINELISLANYSIEETTVPPYDQIVEDFSSTWADMYLDEDLKEQTGQHCYIVHDDCDCGSIRAIVVQPSLNNEAKSLLIDIMDNVIFDLIYNDTVEQATGNDEGSEDSAYGPGFDEDYAALLDFIRHSEYAQENVSDYDYSWLLVLVDNRLDLVEL
jgi:hypothetical protein